MKWMALIAVLLTLGGCGFKDYNNMVMQENATLLTAYGDAMAKQNSEGGRLAIALMFATGAGRQKLARPETAATYLPLVSSAVLPWVTLFHHGSDDDVSQSYAAGRDIYFQSSNSSTHAGSELFSAIKGDGNSNTQYVCPTCDDGTAPEEGEAGITGGLDACSINPPSGWRGSTPLYSPNCSCASHFAGKC
jgi:hypothetical protein